MSDKDDKPTPCWYTGGVWYDADSKPVKRDDDQKPTIIIGQINPEEPPFLKFILDVFSESSG